MERAHKLNWRGLMMVLLSLGAAASAVLAMAGLTACPFIISKALTTILILLIAAIATAGEERRYKWSIVIGLTFSLGGDVLMSLSEGYFLAGLESFLFAHISYLVAFTSHSPFAAKKLPFAGWAAYGVIITGILRTSIPTWVKIPVLLYLLVILTMAAQSGSRCLSSRSAATMIACLGATLFVLSDSMLAFNHFHTPVPHLSTISLATYYAAQWCLALSVPLQGSKEAKR